MKYSVLTEITTKQITELMVGAIECNDMTTAWCRGITLISSEFTPVPGTVWYDQEELYLKPFHVRVKFDREGLEEGNGKGRFLLNQPRLQLGLRRFANDYPTHYGDFIQEQADAVTYDVWLQATVLGKVIYG